MEEYRREGGESRSRARLVVTTFRWKSSRRHVGSFGSSFTFEVTLERSETTSKVRMHLFCHHASRIGISKRYEDPNDGIVCETHLCTS